MDILDLRFHVASPSRKMPTCYSKSEGTPDRIVLQRPASVQEHEVSWMDFGQATVVESIRKRNVNNLGILTVGSLRKGGRPGGGVLKIASVTGGDFHFGP